MNLTIGYRNFSFAPANAPELALAERISYATSKCALGHMLVARSAKGVCAILRGDIQNGWLDPQRQFPNHPVAA